MIVKHTRFPCTLKHEGHCPFLLVEVTSAGFLFCKHSKPLHTGVSLNFSSPEESCHAKVVIGCDGYRSQVREICLKDGPPTFRNMICWRGVVKWPENWPCLKSQRVYWGKDKAGGLAAAIDDQYLGWQVIFPREKQDMDSLPYSR